MCSKVHDKERKSPAGRKPLDPVTMFKVLVLQSLYNISDQQMEYPDVMRWTTFLPERRTTFVSCLLQVYRL
ncbi:MAG: transposase [Pyrinomonadaceae bacterium]